MKKIFLVITICVVCQFVKAQSISEIGKISLSVIMPENVDGLEASQLSKLETKIMQIVTNSGIGVSGNNNSFVIYPQFAIYENNVVEGGMQNIIVIKSELSLFIKQVENNVLFSSISKTISGSGSSKLTAITNAISKIDINDNDFKTFVETGKSKIIKYYESKCSDIIAKSESLVKKQDFEQALGLLMSVPEEVSCYTKVQDKSVEVYKSYQNQKCKALLHDVNISVTNNDYSQALETLKLIDPSSTCFKDAQAIIKKIESKIDAEQKRQLALQMKIYNDQVALEKMRINAIKDVAITYYKNRPKVVYNYIIR
ncbi:MAG TPA: hypothetical protein DCQ29_01175 [Chitinophagaceae bacterium]|nr:hypothetical protein [Chitinophagaceae bacterium]